MPDDYKIKIVTTAEGDGAKKTAEHIKKLGEESKKTESVVGRLGDEIGKKFLKGLLFAPAIFGAVSTSMAVFRAALDPLVRSFGRFVDALKESASAAGQSARPITALSIVFDLLTDAIEVNVNPSLQRLATKTRDYTGLAETAEGAAKKFADAQKELADETNAANTALDHQLQLIREKAEHDVKVAEAEKDLALAEVDAENGDPIDALHKKASIETKFFARRRAILGQSKMEEVDANEAAMRQHRERAAEISATFITQPDLQARANRRLQAAAGVTSAETANRQAFANVERIKLAMEAKQGTTNPITGHTSFGNVLTPEDFEILKSQGVIRPQLIGGSTLPSGVMEVDPAVAGKLLSQGQSQLQSTRANLTTARATLAGATVPDGFTGDVGGFMQQQDSKIDALINSFNEFKHGYSSRNTSIETGFDRSTQLNGIKEQSEGVRQTTILQQEQQRVMEEYFKAVQDGLKKAIDLGKLANERIAREKGSR